MVSKIYKKFKYINLKFKTFFECGCIKTHIQKGNNKTSELYLLLVFCFGLFKDTLLDLGECGTKDMSKKKKKKIVFTIRVRQQL